MSSSGNSQVRPTNRNSPNKSTSAESRFGVLFQPNCVLICFKPQNHDLNPISHDFRLIKNCLSSSLRVFFDLSQEFSKEIAFVHRSLSSFARKTSLLVRTSFVLVFHPNFLLFGVVNKINFVCLVPLAFLLSFLELRIQSKCFHGRFLR